MTEDLGGLIVLVLLAVIYQVAHLYQTRTMLGFSFWGNSVQRSTVKELQKYKEEMRLLLEQLKVSQDPLQKLETEMNGDFSLYRQKFRDEILAAQQKEIEHLKLHMFVQRAKFHRDNS